MIVSRKTGDWYDLEGFWSRLSGPCFKLFNIYDRYHINDYWHALYVLNDSSFYINDKSFEKFKVLDYDNF